MNWIMDWLSIGFIHCLVFLAGAALAALLVRRKRKVVEGRLAKEIRDAVDRLKFLEYAIESTSDCIIVTDLQLNIKYVNPAFSSVYGYARTEILGKSISTLRALNGSKHYIETLRQIASQGSWEGELLHVRKDGSKFPVHVSASVIRDEKGIPIAHIGVIRDITTLKNLERQLREAQKMESMGQLAGGIAHDFNNVLGLIMGSISMIRNQQPHEGIEKYLSMAENAAQRGAEVTGRLLAFAREKSIETTPVSIREVIHELEGTIKHTFEKTIEISTEIQEDLPLVKGDRGQIYQMLLNICLNARDALLEDDDPTKSPRLRIRAELFNGNLPLQATKHESTSHIRIAISDNGIGMDETVKHRIFEPFFTTKSDGRGTGLGLPVVYGIVQSHNGFIDVESAPNKGTTISVYLPASPDQILPTAEVITEIPQRGHGTLLIIEDEPEMLHLVSEVLHSYGYKVIQAQDGLEGYDMFRRHNDSLDGVLLDMGLPKLAGRDLFYRIKKEKPDIPVLMLSGYVENSIVQELLDAGLTSFIQKPFSTRDLLMKIHKAVAQNGCPQGKNSH